MKTVKVAIVGCMLTMITSTTLAQNTSDEDIFDVFDEATSSNAISFGFTETDIIQATDATNTELMIVAPIVYDGSDPILSYDLTMSTTPGTGSPSDQPITKECTFSTAELQNKQEIECPLTIGTDIEPNQTYYLTIFPKKNALLGNPSKEINFNYSDILASNNSIIADTNHSAAPDMCTANISWSQDNEKVTVTWDALITSGKIRIEARGESESSFKAYGITDITAEKYVFIPSQSGTYLVKLVPLDNNNKEAGKPCTQTMHLQDFEVKEIKTQTGPKETLMIIGLIAVIGGYLLLRRKH